MSGVTGWNFPIFRITDGGSAGRLVKSISLPITNSEGLVETYEEVAKRHKLFNHSLTQDVLGWRMTFSLPYSEYGIIETMLKIQDILKYNKAGYNITLIPRSDKPTRKFEVYYSGDSFDMGILPSGRNAVGNRLVAIEFTTKALINDWGWINPNAIVYACWYKHNRMNAYVAP